MRSGFFEDTEVFAEDFATAFGGVISNGVLEDGNNLEVVPSSAMTVSVLSGYCWIEGHYALNESEYSITIPMANGSVARIDRVIARLNLSEKRIELLSITGTISETPLPPSLVRDGTYYDICLAEILIPAGASEITADMITDTRFDQNLCGGVIVRTNDKLAISGKADIIALEQAEQRITQCEDAISSKTITLDTLFSGSSETATISNLSDYKAVFVNVEFIPNYYVSGNASNPQGTIYTGTTHRQWLSLPLVNGTYEYMAFSIISSVVNYYTVTVTVASNYVKFTSASKLSGNGTSYSGKITAVYGIR